MKWVTRKNVGVDRIGCAWLIRRFVDPDAEFLFVDAATSSLPPGAEPFDMPGARLSHRGGHASFHTIVQEYDLADLTLRRIAQMVDEADVTQEVMVEAAAPGLDLICRGIRRTSPDDHVALERGGQIYDALYAELAADPMG
jgi:hypothetical protein